MARIRTIKPEFWTDARTGTLPEFSKCLFLGLLNHADDYGLLDFDPIEWRAKIFPYHSDTTTGAVNAALIDDLLPRGLVVLFAVTNDEEDETKRYLFIKNFHRHQVINKPSKPLLKDWKSGDTPVTYARRQGFEHQTIGPADIGSDRPSLPHSSGSAPVALPPGKERKGKEGKGKEQEAAPSGARSGDLELGLAEPARPPPRTDPEFDLFRRGKDVLGENAGGLIKRLLQAKDGKIPMARAAIEQASIKQNPREYIGAIIRGREDDDKPRVII
ncbi:hypothetical protein [Bradyrhizobium sp. Leo170]|uniref:hypothetical protein n=1 Tax=Bradyrhizobium sp. Leo170 TaxID=1571199 RepID=UPI00102EBC5B|nr:hypothetical protein [Bradyrhizobium sp. Leo170]TAI60696.1 hypothetical protein CWO89_39305 [Bradyrhizobium sp. Leo170]